MLIKSFSRIGYNRFSVFLESTLQYVSNLLVSFCSFYIEQFIRMYGISFDLFTLLYFCWSLLQINLFCASSTSLLSAIIIFMYMCTLGHENDLLFWISSSFFIVVLTFKMCFLNFGSLVVNTLLNPSFSASIVFVI